MKSEFGKGLTYCLGLFLAHKERTLMTNGRKEMPDIWFNGASDHLYELEIPTTIPKTLQERLKTLREKALDWGHGRGLMGTVKVTEKDKEWALNEALLLLRAIDLQLGVKTIKGQWE